jgi:hypothetical protein
MSLCVFGFSTKDLVSGRYGAAVEVQRMDNRTFYVKLF